MNIDKLTNQVQGKAFDDAKQVGKGSFGIESEPKDRHNAQPLDSGKDYVNLKKV